MSTETQTPKIAWRTPTYGAGAVGTAMGGMLDFEITWAKADEKNGLPEGYRVTIKGVQVKTLRGRDAAVDAAKARAERWLTQTCAAVCQ